MGKQNVGYTVSCQVGKTGYEEERSKVVERVKTIIRALYGTFLVCVLICIGLYDASPLMAMCVFLIGIVANVIGRIFENKYEIEW